MKQSYTGPDHEYVTRDTGSIVVFWVGIAAVVAVLVFAALGNDWPFFAVGVPVGLFAAWAMWLVLFHPHVRWDSHRVKIVNIGRVHELPWAEVASVTQRLGIVFEVADGRRFTAAGASAPRGMGNVIGGITGNIGEEAANFNRNAEPLDAMRASAEPTDVQVTSRWDALPLIIGGALALIAIIDIVIALTR